MIGLIIGMVGWILSGAFQAILPEKHQDWAFFGVYWFGIILGYLIYAIGGK